MGFLGGLIQGATRGLGGYLHGKQQGLEMLAAEQQRRAGLKHQTLMDSLTQANLDRQTRAIERDQEERSALNQYLQKNRPELVGLPQNITGSVLQSGLAPRNEDANAPGPIARHLAAQKELASYTAGLPQRPTSAKLELTPAERRAARQTIIALRAQNTQEDTDPTAGVYPITSSVPQGFADVSVFGAKPFAGVAGPIAQRNLSVSQAEFRRAGVTARHHYLSLLPHSRGSLGILGDIDKATSAPPGETRPDVLQSYRQARDDIIASLEASLGQELTAQGTLPQPSTSPPQQRIGGRVIQPQYNPKFWTP